MGSKAGSASKIRLSSFEELIGGTENTAGEQIINTNDDIEDIIIQLLEEWQGRQ